MRGDSDECGAPGRIRTCDARLRSPALYPLSYEGGAGRWVVSWVAGRRTADNRRTGTTRETNRVHSRRQAAELR